MIAVVDYGISNIGSLVNMLRKIGTAATVTNKAGEIALASKIILPGIGAFDAGMQHLTELNLIETLNEKVLKEKIPVLGICLGMELMATKSEEGNLRGLSWIDAEVKKFNFASSNTVLKIPHMGWNYTEQQKPSVLFDNFPSPPKFYFVHGYYVAVNDKSDELCSTNYGYPFTSAIERGNIAGVQFHPEKSHKFGMNLLKNFVERF